MAAKYVESSKANGIIRLEYDDYDTKEVPLMIHDVNSLFFQNCGLKVINFDYRVKFCFHQRWPDTLPYLLEEGVDEISKMLI